MWYNKFVDRKTDDPRFTIDALCERSGLPRRTIRFYIAEGLLMPPAGRGRGGFYDASHLERIEAILTLRARGLTLPAIRAALAAPAAAAPCPERHEPPTSAPHRVARTAVARYELIPGAALELSLPLEGKLGARLAPLLALFTSALDDTIE